MKFSRCCLLSFLLLGLLANFGCKSNVSVRGVSAYAVSLQDLSVETSPAQATVTIRFVNENTVPVGLTRSSHKLFLNDELVGTVENKRPIGLQMLSDRDLVYALVLKGPEAVATIKRFAIAGSANYRLVSEYEISAGDSELKAESDERGAIDLSQVK